jgi:hypothetical protein
MNWHCRDRGGLGGRLVEVAVQHALAVQSHEDTPELRSMIREGIKETEAAAV